MNIMRKPDSDHSGNDDQPQESEARPFIVPGAGDDEDQLDGPDYADIFSKPPTVALTHIIMGMVIQLFLHAGPGILGSMLWYLPGVALVLVALKVAHTAFKEFGAHETTVPTDEPAAALVTTGIYARTRNPIYIGLCMLYVGLGLILGNVWVLILTLPFFAYLNKHVVPREEDYLARKFGAAFESYQAEVPRWL